jgi:hypothetical protein
MLSKIASKMASATIQIKKLYCRVGVTTAMDTEPWLMLKNLWTSISKDLD